MTNHRGQREDHDLSLLLSDDVLAEVLRRLAPRCLAASHCVCKAWHAVIDTRRLLRADLLPLSLDGIVIQFRSHVYSEFFSRPSTPTMGPSISGTFEHLLTTDAWAETTDHCNGLLLLKVYDSYDEYVANPATGWAAPLPPCPSPCFATHGDHYNKYLLFDPTVSAHYEVLSVPRLFPRNLETEAPEKPPEWPPATLIMRVFSSVSQRWEERSFSRQGEPARLATVVQFYSEDLRYAVNWRGSLFVHCEKEFVMRISSSDNTFEVIEPPVGLGGDLSLRYGTELHLGRSDKGVYFASLVDRWLRVWILDESCGRMKWVSKHDNNLEPVLPRRASNQHVHGPWILQDINYHSGAALDHNLTYDNEESLSGQKCKWNYTPPNEKFVWSSDGDDALEHKDITKVCGPGYLNILGFHPYKEIVFLSESMEIGLAYHLKTSKFQVLGNIYPTNYHDFVDLREEMEITASFPYTPCLMEMCPRNNSLKVRVHE